VIPFLHLVSLVPLVPGLVSIAGLAVDPGADVVDPQVDGCRPDRWLYILISDYCKDFWNLLKDIIKHMILEFA
jgi:hypothetical protein